jgi:hypothetical protein
MNTVSKGMGHCGLYTYHKCDESRPTEPKHRNLGLRLGVVVRFMPSPSRTMAPTILFSATAMVLELTPGGRGVLTMMIVKP